MKKRPKLGAGPDTDEEDKRWEPYKTYADMSDGSASSADSDHDLPYSDAEEELPDDVQETIDPVTGTLQTSKKTPKRVRPINLSTIDAETFRASLTLNAQEDWEELDKRRLYRYLNIVIDYGNMTQEDLDNEPVYGGGRDSDQNVIEQLTKHWKPGGKCTRKPIRVKKQVKTQGPKGPKQRQQRQPPEEDKKFVPFGMSPCLNGFWWYENGKWSERRPKERVFCFCPQCYDERESMEMQIEWMKEAFEELGLEPPPELEMPPELRLVI